MTCFLMLWVYYKAVVRVGGGGGEDMGEEQMLLTFTFIQANKQLYVLSHVGVWYLNVKIRESAHLRKSATFIPHIQYMQVVILV